MIPSAKPKILSVKDLTFALKNQIEKNFYDVWIAGEIGRVNEHRSGIYFVLKDEEAVIDAAIWRRSQSKVLRFPLETGRQVIVHGSVDLYPPQGRYKIIVDHIEPKGIGLLQKRFEELKKKLAGEGLFEESRKRPLPLLPRKIGLVTAPSGAAIRDMISTILGRFPRASIVLKPSLVQGASAAKEIARSLEDLNQLDDVDVIIVGRGGGSLEDLWAFNEEVVARAIAASRIPVVSAVGHEVDYSISDFVADARAKTPTDAGVMVVPRESDLHADLREKEKSLRFQMNQLLLIRRNSLETIRHHWVFRRPVDLVQNLLRRLEANQDSLASRTRDRIAARRESLAEVWRRLARFEPSAAVASQKGAAMSLGSRLQGNLERRLYENWSRYRLLAEKLEGRSPVAILSRGYSLTRKEGEVTFLTSAAEVKPGDRIETTFHAGSLVSRVERVNRSTAP